MTDKQLTKEHYDECVKEFMKQGHDEASAHGLASQVTYATDEEWLDYEAAQRKMEDLKQRYLADPENSGVVQMKRLGTDEVYYRLETDMPWIIEREQEGYDWHKHYMDEGTIEFGLNLLEERRRNWGNDNLSFKTFLKGWVRSADEHRDQTGQWAHLRNMSTGDKLLESKVWEALSKNELLKTVKEALAHVENSMADELHVQTPIGVYRILGLGGNRTIHFEAKGVESIIYGKHKHVSLLDALKNETEDQRICRTIQYDYDRRAS